MCGRKLIQHANTTTWLQIHSEGMFSSASTKKPVSVDRIILNGAKYRAIREGNVSEAEEDLRLGQRFTSNGSDQSMFMFKMVMSDQTEI